MLNCVTNYFNYTCDVSHMLYIVAPAFSSTHSFCRARSHDYLVALPAVAGDLAVASMDDAPLVSAGASASAPLICAASTGSVSGGFYYEFKWIHDPPGFGRVIKNLHGATGWGHVVRTTNPCVKANSRIRFHLCAHNPCSAHYPLSKYSNFASCGPPRHVQAVAHRPDLPAAVEAPSDAAILPAVADAPAVAEAPSDAAAASPSGVDAPPDPSDAALNLMAPPAPSSPNISRPLVDPLTVARTIGSLPPAVAAQHAVHATLLALAREIRRPCRYVGYSAFVLLGLLKKSRPCAWEGATYMDLLEVYAPWATTTCTRHMSATAIACSFVMRDDCSAVLSPICAEHHLSKTSHWVVGIPCPPLDVSGADDCFTALYATHGVAVVPTVTDGDCGLDVMTTMLEIPQSAQARNDLRIELSDYLLSRVGEHWMHDIMVACQELCADEVRLSKSAPSAFVAPVAVAPAVADRAIVPAFDDFGVESEPLDEETCRAISWATNLHDSCSVVALVRALPAAVVEEQVALFRRRGDTPAVAATSRRRITVGLNPGHRVRQVVCEQLSKFGSSRGLAMGARMPRGHLNLFMSECIEWKGKQWSLAVRGKRISQWYSRWCMHGAVAAVADDAMAVPTDKLAPRTCSRAERPGKIASGKGPLAVVRITRRSMSEQRSSNGLPASAMPSIGSS